MDSETRDNGYGGSSGVRSPKGQNGGDYEGWLYKKGKLRFYGTKMSISINRKNWKKRWFTLNNGELKYYNSQVSKQVFLLVLVNSGE